MAAWSLADMPGMALGVWARAGPAESSAATAAMANFISISFNVSQPASGRNKTFT